MQRDHVITRHPRRERHARVDRVTASGRFDNASLRIDHLEMSDHPRVEPLGDQVDSNLLTRFQLQSVVVALSRGSRRVGQMVDRQVGRFSKIMTDRRQMIGEPGYQERTWIGNTVSPDGPNFVTTWRHLRRNLDNEIAMIGKAFFRKRKWINGRQFRLNTVVRKQQARNLFEPNPAGRSEGEFGSDLSAAA